MRRVAVLFLALFLASVAGAQEPPAVLVADQVRVEGNAVLVAEGNIEVLYGDVRLKAARITYDRTTDSLSIDGPITLTDGADMVILADSAALDADLQNGMLRSARAVLAQQLQLAAAEIQRVDGRYTQFYKTVASSCQVCANDPVPLWQIRARRIIHDQLERQLYFEGAQLRVMDVPILALPRLRLPDPTLDRATGFLIPKFRSTSRLGVGVKIPYFITLGDHADLTFTPYLATKTRTLEGRFRRAFAHGDLSFEGAVSRDDELPGRNRGYLFGEGSFGLVRDYRLNFDIELTSDDAYLLDYGYSDKDRLNSAIELTRTRRNKFVSASLTHIHTLRPSEDNDTIHSVIGSAIYHQRFPDSVLGGEAGLRFELFGGYRRSDLAVDGPDADLIVDGRDTARASLRFDWQKSWQFRNGMIARALGEVNADFYAIGQDAAFASSVSHITPQVAVELRWPWVKAGAGGASHVIEPVAQLVWTDEDAAPVPNEDSTLVEFDEGNLFSFSRFAGADLYERGLRANLGVTWTRYDPAGWSLGLTVGRTIRADDQGQFSAASGLAGDTSDWLAALQLKLPGNLTLTNRALFDDSLSFAKNETRLNWRNERLGLSSSYVWMESDPAENRPLDTSELTFDAGYKLGRQWTGKANGRYDFVAGRGAYAGVGLEYRSECVVIELSLSRRFTSSTSVRPTTDFGLAVSLIGFGSGSGAPGPTRSCRK